MDNQSAVIVAIALVGIVFSVIGYLLQSKDTAQEKQIGVLFTKHDQDAKELQDLKLLIASQHYVKGELDLKFEKLEATFARGFTNLGEKFDNLSAVLIEHIQKEDARS